MFDLFGYSKLLQQMRSIEMKISELDDALGLVSAQLTKAKVEILAKQNTLMAQIAELESKLQNLDVEVPEDVIVALDSLKSTTQELDDVVPDEPVVE